MPRACRSAPSWSSTGCATRSSRCITVTSLQIGFLLVGTVLVESTLGLGGLGSLITDSIQNRDYPVIQASVLFLAVAFVLLNLVTDLLYAVIDPRIRYA